jgi:hypothetical protein
MANMNTDHNVKTGQQNQKNTTAAEDAETDDMKKSAPGRNNQMDNSTGSETSRSNSNSATSGNRPGQQTQQKTSDTENTPKTAK